MSLQKQSSEMQIVHSQSNEADQPMPKAQEAKAKGPVHKPVPTQRTTSNTTDSGLLAVLILVITVIAASLFPSTMYLYLQGNILDVPTSHMVLLLGITVSIVVLMTDMQKRLSGRVENISLIKQELVQSNIDVLERLDDIDASLELVQTDLGGLDGGVHARFANLERFLVHMRNISVSQSLAASTTMPKPVAKPPAAPDIPMSGEVLHMYA